MYTSGTVLDKRYTIDAILGQGSLGSLYLARSPQFYLVAIKEIHPPPAADQEEGLRQVQREASILCRLSHPRLPRIIDYFEIDGIPHLVMEYIKGHTLASLVATEAKPLSEERVRRWADQLCEVLGYLHRHDPPIVFRDLKPTYIMVDVEGQIRLIDFGISKFLNPHGVTEPSVWTRGSVGFAAPELAKGRADVRSDVYSLGATLYYMLAQSPPAEASAHSSDPSLRMLRPDLNPAFVRGVEELMTVDLAQRPGSIADARKLLGLPPAETESVDMTSTMQIDPATAWRVAGPDSAARTPMPTPGAGQPAPVTPDPQFSPASQRFASPTAQPAVSATPRPQPSTGRPSHAVRPVASPSPPPVSIVHPSAPVWPPPPAPAVTPSHTFPTRLIFGGLALFVVCLGGVLAWPAFHHPSPIIPPPPPTASLSPLQASPVAVSPGTGAPTASPLASASAVSSSPSSAVPTPPPALGRLEVATHPSVAKVDINGQTRGQSFLTLNRLPIGSYHLRISKTGYQTHRQDIFIHAGETLAVDLTLVPIQHSLKISVVPDDSQLSMDGQLQGLLGHAVTTLNVGVGTHILAFTHPGYLAESKTIHVTPGQVSIPLNVSLTPSGPASTVRPLPPPVVSTPRWRPPPTTPQPQLRPKLVPKKHLGDWY